MFDHAFCREFIELDMREETRMMHEEAEMAKKRLIFEEFFVFSAGLALMRASRAMKKTAPYENCDLSGFYSRLPF